MSSDRTLEIIRHDVEMLRMREARAFAAQVMQRLAHAKALRDASFGRFMQLVTGSEA